MRAPFQILAIPYRRRREDLFYCVFHRADIDQWQFFAGGSEDAETPDVAAKREIFEEIGVVVDTLLRLRSMCFIPTDIFASRHLIKATPRNRLEFSPRNELLYLRKKLFLVRPHLCQFVCQVGKTHLLIHNRSLSHFASSRTLCAVLPE